MWRPALCPTSRVRSVRRFCRTKKESKSLKVKFDKLLHSKKRSATLLWLPKSRSRGFKPLMLSPGGLDTHCVENKKPSRPAACPHSEDHNVGYMLGFQFFS
jgi:hypothetical protein